MKPIRIQRSRAKGWRNPDNTLYVGRPGKWGNPFLYSEFGDRAASMYEECIRNNAMVFKYIDEIQASLEYERFKWMASNLHLLKGKNLSCFCSHDKKCHADILLNLAND